MSVRNSYNNLFVLNGLSNEQFKVEQVQDNSLCSFNLPINDYLLLKEIKRQLLTCDCCTIIKGIKAY